MFRFHVVFRFGVSYCKQFLSQHKILLEHSLIEQSVLWQGPVGIRLIKIMFCLSVFSLNTICVIQWIQKLPLAGLERSTPW
jgi:hypothetical protein